VSGSTVSEKVGGILAIRELVDCTSAAAESKVVKFATALSNALSQASDTALIELIADALGHMAKNSPVSHVDYLEMELNRALDWLKGHKNSFNRRFAACTILAQLAKNARTVFFARIHEFFDLIWSPMWDPREPIRLAASRALSACLAVLRERTYHLQWYCLIYDQLKDGLTNGSEEFVHGSILVLIEVLQYTGDFMVPRFKETCNSIMALKDHKSRLVRGAIVSLLPSLASLSPDAFARAHMEVSIEFLLKSSRNADLKPQALLSTGRLCLAMGPHLVSRIDDLMNIIKEAFGTSELL
jgi:serine/threonine-protein kinase mTOR